MAYVSENTRPEEIEREIEQDRQRIGRKLDEIQNRMSPGQLVDEAIAYAKGSGGAEFLSNLGGSVKTNPVPVALMGISLAWLMAGGNKAEDRAQTSSTTRHRPEYPLATVTGHLQRVGPVEDNGTGRYSHFKDAAGNRFTSMTDAKGHRAGHFTDDSGTTYRGFVDSSGRPVMDVRDESGSLFDEATGWLSQTFESVSHSAGTMRHDVVQAGRATTREAAALGASVSASVREQTAKVNETILRQFQDQPLIGGALAFALGAAIGAALPRTEREDEMLGEMSDQVKGEVASGASDALDTAEGVATDVSHKVASIAADVHDVARDRIAEEARPYRSGDETSAPLPH